MRHFHLVFSVFVLAFTIFVAAKTLPPDILREFGPMQEAAAADFVYSPACPVLGGDAGNTMLVSNLTPNTQLMVSSNYAINYRMCKPLLDAGTAGCTALFSDAPLPASQQIDLCVPTGYTRASFYKLYDGGNPSVCMYLVSPKTVCAINSP